MTIATECEACGTRVEGADLRAFGDAHLKEPDAAPETGANRPWQDNREHMPEADAGNFRGPRSLFDTHGFDAVEDRGRYTVVRRRA